MRNTAIYLALGLLADGTRDILGMRIENTEGAKFWMKMFNDLKTRGMVDILIAFMDGLKGIGEALYADRCERRFLLCGDSASPAPDVAAKYRLWDLGLRAPATAGFVRHQAAHQNRRLLVEEALQSRRRGLQLMLGQMQQVPTAHDGQAFHVQQR